MIGTAWLFSITHISSAAYFKTRLKYILSLWPDTTKQYHLIRAYLGAETDDGIPSLELFYWVHQNKLAGIHHEYNGEIFIDSAIERLPSLNIDMRKFISGDFISSYDAPWAVLNLVTPDNLITRVIEFNDLINGRPYMSDALRPKNNAVIIEPTLKKVYVSKYLDHSNYERNARFLVYAPLTGDFSGYADMSAEFTKLQIALVCDDALIRQLDRIHITMMCGISISTIIDKLYSIDKSLWNKTVDKIRNMYLLHINSSITPKDRIYDNITELIKLLIQEDAIPALFLEAAIGLEIEERIRDATFPVRLILS